MAVIVFLLTMVILLFFSAFVVDLGLAWSTKSDAQNAADSAVLAAAGVYVDDGDLDAASTRAKDIVASTFGSGSVVWPGCSDGSVLPDVAPADQGQGNTCISLDTAAGRARVVVQPGSVPTIFGSFFGIASLSVSASAEAEWTVVTQATAGPSSCTLCALGTDNGDGVATIDLNGTGDPWEVEGWVHSNGTMKIQDPSYLVTSPDGNISLGSPPIQCSNVNSVTCPPNYDTTPTTIADPLAAVPDPPAPGSAVNWPCPSGCSILHPGTYRGPFNYNSGTTYLMPGNYIFSAEILALGGSLEMHPSAGPDEGVTLFFVGSSYLEIRNSGSIKLRPPTTGPYEGMLVYYERTNTNTLVWRGSKNDATGTIYAPQAKLRFSDDIRWTGTHRFIARTISNQNTSWALTPDPAAGNGATTSSIGSLNLSR